MTTPIAPASAGATETPAPARSGYEVGPSFRVFLRDLSGICGSIDQEDAFAHLLLIKLAVSVFGLVGSELMREERIDIDTPLHDEVGAPRLKVLRKGQRA
ncbi:MULTISPECIES: hypothetical protein [Mameliella]|uniref:hypothetical protein n=1 Tax=Mameliella TaxID=1434019 RepID=UPI0010567850|nr:MULTISPECIES: hypothetical protein [Mameliella]MCR9272469.1 hypothetical protein [Paracoccaceae bacterium]